MTNPASKLSPPTLHWGTVGPNGDQCDLCRATIKPYGDCFVSIRRAFEFQNDRHTHRMVEVEPIKVLMCVDCGWSRPYAPVPREGAPMAPDAPKGPQTGNTAQDGPTYHDAGVMDDA